MSRYCRGGWRGLLHRPISAGIAAGKDYRRQRRAVAGVASAAASAPAAPAGRPAYTTVSAALPAAAGRSACAYVSPAMAVEVVLAPRDPARMASQLAADYARPAAGARWLAKGQFAARYAPAAARRAAVVAFLRARHLAVGATGSPFLIRATGTSAQVAAAFRTTLKTYHQDRIAYFANATAAVMPRAAAAGVLGLVGLTNTVRVHTAIMPRDVRPSRAGRSAAARASCGAPTPGHLAAASSPNTEAGPLVAALARRFAGTVPAKISSRRGWSGALEAARTFDPGRGVPFTGYAVSFVTGEMLAAARAESPTHVSRGARELARRVEVAGSEITAERGRPPTVDELAEVAELGTEQVIDGLPGPGRPRAARDRRHGARATGTRCRHRGGRRQARARCAVRRLDRRSRAVIALRFGAELSQAEIGERAGDLADARVAALALGARGAGRPDPSGGCRYPRSRAPAPALADVQPDRPRRSAGARRQRQPGRPGYRLQQLSRDPLGAARRRRRRRPGRVQGRHQLDAAADRRLPAPRCREARLSTASRRSVPRPRAASDLHRRRGAGAVVADRLDADAHVGAQRRLSPARDPQLRAPPHHRARDGAACVERGGHRVSALRAGPARIRLGGHRVVATTTWPRRPGRSRSGRWWHSRCCFCLR